MELVDIPVEGRVEAACVLMTRSVVVAGTVVNGSTADGSENQGVKVNVVRTHVIDLIHDPNHATIDGG